MATEIQGAKIVTEEIENAAGANPYSITLKTKQASTSGSAIDFTGIPAGTKQIVIMMDGVSTDGSVNYLCQLGDGGGFETSGYISNAAYSTTSRAHTTGFGLVEGNGSGETRDIVVTLNLMDTSTFHWCCTFISIRDGSNEIGYGGGGKSLSAELTQVRLTCSGDDWDAGAMNISFQ